MTKARTAAAIKQQGTLLHSSRCSISKTEHEQDKDGHSHQVPEPHDAWRQVSKKQSRLMRVDECCELHTPRRGYLKSLNHFS